MILKYYFNFERTESTKTRYDLLSYSKPVYPALQVPFLYFTKTPDRIRAKQRTKTELSISTAKGYLTGLYIPDLTKPFFAYGDIKGTQDLLLALIGNNKLEIFIAPEHKNLIEIVTNLYFDKELDQEIESLKLRTDQIKQAKEFKNDFAVKSFQSN